jgi:hypothetical protein
MRFDAMLLTSFLLVTALPVADAAAQSSTTPTEIAPIGKVVTATGAVTVEHTAATVVQANLSTGATAAKVGDFVFKGDVVQTGADSKLGIAFTDGTAFNLSSNARMELNEFVYNPDSTSNASSFNLVKGTFTFVAGKVAKTGSMKVDTPVATMGIRGTTPRVEIADDGTVRFSTLVEEKATGATPLPQTKKRAAAQRRQTRTTAASVAEDQAFNKQFNLEYKLCQRC